EGLGRFVDLPGFHWSSLGAEEAQQFLQYVFRLLFWVPPAVTMTSTLSATSSAARAGSRSTSRRHLGIRSARLASPHSPPPLESSPRPAGQPGRRVSPASGAACALARAA